MSLPLGLQALLEHVAEDLSKGTLGANIDPEDEPFFPFRRYFYGNSCNGADEVAMFLNNAVGQRTDSRYEVIFADKYLLAEQSKGCRLTLAYVPKGLPADNTAAQLFILSEYGCGKGMHYATRASDELITSRQQHWD